MIDIKGGRVSIGDLEKHIDDVRKGRGYLSKEIPTSLLNSKIESSNILATRDVKSFGLYQQYLTTFSYNKRARFISGVERAANTLSKIV